MAADENAQYEQHDTPAERDAVQPTMEKIVPRAELCSVIEPRYPKGGSGGAPVGGRMLRMYSYFGSMGQPRRRGRRGRALLDSRRSITTR